MNTQTFKALWETEAAKHPLPTQGDIIDDCSPEVAALLDKIGNASESELAELIQTPDFPDVQIVDDCSPEVGKFLDEIAAAGPKELAQLLA